MPMPNVNAAEIQQMPQGAGQDVVSAARLDVENNLNPLYGLRNEAFYQMLISFAVDLRSMLADAPDLRHQVSLDLEGRAQFGEKKYGTRLKTNNGRNTILDLYQEILDAINYTKQGLLEGKL